ncbi:MAG: hypothetical protein ABH986_00715 [archaeon]
MTRKNSFNRFSSGTRKHLRRIKATPTQRAKAREQELRKRFLKVVQNGQVRFKDVEQVIKLKLNGVKSPAFKRKILTQLFMEYTKYMYKLGRDVAKAKRALDAGNGTLGNLQTLAGLEIAARKAKNKIGQRIDYLKK